MHGSDWRCSNVSALIGVGGGIHVVESECPLAEDSDVGGQDGEHGDNDDDGWEREG